MSPVVKLTEGRDVPVLLDAEHVVVTAPDGIAMACASCGARVPLSGVEGRLFSLVERARVFLQQHARCQARR